MTQGNDADALRARKAKLKALTLAKQKRALEVNAVACRNCYVLFFSIFFSPFNTPSFERTYLFLT